MGDLITIECESLPADLGERLTDYANVKAIGDLSLLSGETLGLLYSRKCPGSVILKFFDLLSDWSKSEITLASGFHSPLEREALKSLWNSKARFIVCPARSIENMKIPKD